MGIEKIQHDGHVHIVRDARRSAVKTLCAGSTAPSARRSAGPAVRTLGEPCNVGPCPYPCLMPWSQLVTAAATLIVAFIGATAARWNMRDDRERESAAQAKKGEQEAIQELIAATRLLAHRANAFRMTVKLLHSRGARRQRRQGDMVPIDPEAAFDRLVEADQALAGATGRVWLSGEPEAVRLANALTLAAADYVGAHSDQPLRGLRKIVRDLELQYTHKMPGQEARIQEAAKTWGAACRALAEYARKKYGLEYIDLTETTDAAATVCEP